jgi:hypothetical protein
MLAVMGVVAVIFAAMLVILKITGTDGGNGIAATPTPSPINGAFLAPQPTPAVWKTVTSQDAASVGRADCPQGWAAYTDQKVRFSICYPAGSGVTASDFAVNVDSPDHSVSVEASWNARPHTTYYPPSPENCPYDTNIVEGPATSTFTQIMLFSGTVPACVVLGRLGGDIHADVPLAKDGSAGEGYIQWFVGFTSTTGVPPIGQSIIQTLSVNFR